MIKIDKWCYKFNHPINEEWLDSNRFHYSYSRECFVRSFPAYKHGNSTVLSCEIAVDDETKMIKINIYNQTHSIWGPWYGGIFSQYDPDFIYKIHKRIHSELSKLGIVERMRKTYGKSNNDHVRNRSTV